MKQSDLQDKRYQWQGEPVTVEFGQSVVRTNEERPMWWYNYECDMTHPKGIAVIEAIRVTQRSQSFVMANHYGIGVSKLLKGGWANHTHFSLPADGFKPHGYEDLIVRVPFILEFNEEEYAAHEAGRLAWQEKEYPEQFAKMEQLRSAIIRR